MPIYGFTKEDHDALAIVEPVWDVLADMLKDHGEPFVRLANLNPEQQAAAVGSLHGPIVEMLNGIRVAALVLVDDPEGKEI